MSRYFAVIFSGLIVLPILFGCNSSDERVLMNVSYDPTRELYREYNDIFVKHWLETTGETIKIDQSNGGSGKQALAVAQGSRADVVTLALAFDIDLIGQKTDRKLLAEDWQSRLPNNSCPYTSTIVFLVRKGNPKGINDWNDLLKPDVKIITPDPVTSGGARWNYLAAWGYKLKMELGDLSVLDDPAKTVEVAEAQKKAKDFVAQIFNSRKVPVWDTGARGATMTFVDHKQGDVLLAWENEAMLSLANHAEEVEIVVPSISILAEPAVAVVDGYAKKNGNEDLAKAYLLYLYEPVAQELIAKHNYRPSDPEILKKYESKFRPVETFTIDHVFGGWTKAQKEHFEKGGTFEQIGK